MKKGKGRSRDGASKKRCLEELGGKESGFSGVAFQPAPLAEDDPGVAEEAAPTEGVGFYAKESKESKTLSFCFFSSTSNKA